MLLMSALIFSCKDDDEDTPTTPVDNNEIVGTWELDSINTTAGAPIADLESIKLLAPCVFDLKLTFTNDNKVSAKDCPSAMTYLSTFIPISADTKWKVENGNLNVENGANKQTLPIVQAPSKMKINVTIAGGSSPRTAVLVFKRV